MAFWKSPRRKEYAIKRNAISKQLGKASSTSESDEDLDYGEPKSIT